MTLTFPQGLWAIEYNAWSNLMQEISILQILITFLYGAIDDLYQKNARFSKLKLLFFSIHSFRLSTVFAILCSISTEYSLSKFLRNTYEFFKAWWSFTSSMWCVSNTDEIWFYCEKFKQYGISGLTIVLMILWIKVDILI